MDILTLKRPLDIVLDLPPLYTRPSAQVLLDTLDALALGPATFDGDGDETAQAIIHGLPRYLTDIISSRLSWINDATMRELVWETTSLRLSERSGRNGKLVDFEHILGI